MGWTKEQQQAIDLRGKNLLVSAAAGSGKTAVLVERIVKMVCEENYDIDKILVVTFTKAAAAEMKERIGNRLLEESISHPDNAKIQEQLSYIHRAPISTIHSFCTRLLRNHFHLISLDPGFRIGEEGEMTLLKEQVLDELLEESYAKRGEDFLRFVEAYSYGKDDRVIGNMILRLFEFSTSHPMPEQWLMEAGDALSVKEKEPIWLEKVMEYADHILEDGIDCLERAIRISYEEPLLIEKYVPFLMEEKEAVYEIRKKNCYSERVEAFREFVFKRIPSVRTKETHIKELQEAAKALRDEAKNMIQNLKVDCFVCSLSEIEHESELLKPYMDTLIDLVLRFSEKYMACKLEKNVLEFSDLEHFALKLLITGYKDGKVSKTPLAEELSNGYQAVFTDEYQDSNLIQEVLLKAVSKEEDGNRFMVGDIKQSIYKFRNARPEIFLEKYAQGETEEMHVNIELRNNFRSKPEVLYGINYIFYQIMKPSLGEVSYEEKVALKPPEEKIEDLELRRQKGDIVSQELWIMDLEKEEDPQGEWRELSKVELEAKMVADRIKKLTLCNGEYAALKTGGKDEQAVRYRDIVILLRTMEGWSSAFEEVLTMEGIPVHTESRRGYFDTFEIRVLLNLLSVVDNIYQDIPLAAVLRSPVGGFTGEDMARIRSLVIADRRTEDSLYEEMVHYLNCGENMELKEKITRVISLLKELREEKTRLSLPELIWSLLEKTDYYHLVGSMPNGEQRMANIRMFLEKAAEYEKTSFKGVFHFIQYMDQIRSYDVDYGEASVLGEEADVVRIMSIHKSKGLEFPIVILAGTGKMFNFMDRNQRMLLHPDYYVGLDCVDLKNRVKYPSQQKKMISRQLVLSMLGEELRVLYVAMTRARDKLIMTGTMEDFGKMLGENGRNPISALQFGRMIKAKTYLHWIFPAILRDHCMDGFRDSYNIDMEEQGYFHVEGETTHFQCHVVKAGAVLGKEVVSQLKDQYDKKELYAFLNREMDTEEIKKMQASFAWEYPEKAELKVRSKWSVSQLKEESMEEALLVPVGEDGEKYADYPIQSLGQKKDTEKSEEETAKNKTGTIPQFLKEKEEESILTGASRGTAVHKLMEELSFAEIEEQGLEAGISKLVENGKFPEEYVASIPMKKMERFFKSSLGKRIIEAERENRLYKEVQFMIGVPIREMEQEVDSDELVLVQGIIDLYMEEEDGLVLLDYKTDYVEAGKEEVLIERYRPQLLWYKRALEQMTGKTVKETLIYSFGVSKALIVDKTVNLLKT